MSAKNKKNQKISDNNRMSWLCPEIRHKRIVGIVKHTWGDVERSKYYHDSIKPLIWNGITFIQMYKQKMLDKSPPTLKKMMLMFGSPDDIIKAQENVKGGKALGGLSKKGKPSSLKGKSYTEILGSEDKAKARSCLTSVWMKTNNIRKYCTKISKPQKMLFGIIQKGYPEAVLEYDGIKTPDGRTLWLDIAIVDKKIDIEYDGVYWHDKNNKKHTQKAKWSDATRDEYLKTLGWTICRFQFHRNPGENELVELAKKYSIIT